MTTSVLVERALARSHDLMCWTADSLNDLHLPAFRDPDSKHVKRAHIAGACLHAAIEHSQAIVVLVDKGLVGSALALVRILVEAWIRGLWVLRAASEKEVDAAGLDNFPNDINKLVKELERKGGIPAGMLSEVKQANWRALCSYTHTGFHQIGARLTPTGLGYAFSDEQAVWALKWADNISMLVVVEIARMAHRDDLGLAALARMTESATTANQ